MSLSCCECKYEMGPSEALPGREGTFVQPHVKSLVYIPSETLKYKIVYLQSQESRSLCFNCIDSKLPEQRKPVLKAIYDCYESETEFQEAEQAVLKVQEEKGMISFNDPLMDKKFEAYEFFIKMQKKVSRECIFCGNTPENGKPFFTAVAIDRAYSRQQLSGLFVHDNYSFTNIRTGRTNFRICFDDFSSYFPNSFKQLSCDLIGEENPARQSNELYISKEFEEAVEAAGESIDDLVSNFPGVIVIREKAGQKSGLN